ncbi:MAG: hypothetical protein R3A52_15570 [Polyangiales bacterium]
MTRRALAALSLALCPSACVYDVELVRGQPVTGDDAGVTAWRAVESGVTQGLRAVWGSGPSDVWAVGDGGVALHWDGARWTTVATGVTATLYGVWVRGPRDAWAVGGDASGPVALRYDGARWSQVTVPARDREPFRAVWGDADREVWVAGGDADDGDPPAWEWDGSQWHAESFGGSLSPALTAVAGGPSDDDLWFATAGPLAFHKVRGASPTSTSAPGGARFGGALCVTPAGGAWATSEGATVFRYESTAWVATAPPATAPLRGVWCGATTVWAVGDRGQTARWSDGQWRAESAPDVSLSAVWSDGSVAWAVGARGAVLRLGP